MTTKDAPTPPEPVVEPDTPDADVLAALGEIGGRGTPEAVSGKLQALVTTRGDKTAKRSTAAISKAMRDLESKGLVWPRGDEWLLSSAFLKEGAA
jgi:hypothetical protein